MKNELNKLFARITGSEPQSHFCYVDSNGGDAVQYRGTRTPAMSRRLLDLHASVIATCLFSEKHVR